MLVSISILASAGCAYLLLFDDVVAPLIRSAYFLLAPALSLILVLSRRGWDQARYAAVVLNTVIVGLILPLPSPEFGYLPHVAIVPSALAMVLAGPSWVIGSAIGTFAILLVRAGGFTTYLEQVHVLSFAATVSCLVVSRLVIDAARREAEARATQAERAQVASEQQAEALRQQQTSLHFQATLLGAVERPVLATDPHGRVTYWNHAAEQLFGWTVAEIARAAVRRSHAAAVRSSC